MHEINVSLVYANPQQQWLYETRVARGTSAIDLIGVSNFMRQIPELAGADVTTLSLGIYAQRIQGDYLLEEGDRVEIYRPLKADPKEVRRQLALMGKTIGKNKRGAE